VAARSATIRRRIASSAITVPVGRPREACPSAELHPRCQRSPRESTAPDHVVGHFLHGERGEPYRTLGR
jgi:hypothetical protein